MASSYLWHVSVRVSGDAEEAVAALFERLFGRPPSIYARAGTGTRVISDYGPKLPFLRSDLRSRLRTELRQVRSCGVSTGAASVTIRRIRREDWAESWKRHFPPLEIGRKVLIRPSWSRRRPRSGQVLVEIDPGLSFGTGLHPTTAFCLQQLVSRRRSGQPQSLLDIGTGSGILAIVAAKCGYHPVIAFDSDPAAVRVAKANALKNRTHNLSVFRKDLTRMGLRNKARFDVVCANLSSDLLVEQRNRIMNRIKPAGTLLLAGILKKQFDQVYEIYSAAGLKLITTRAGKEWQSGTFAFADTIVGAGRVV